MPKVLKDIRITEVSSVDRGAGEGVTVMLMKRAAQGDDMTEAEIAKAIATGVAAEVAKAVAPLQTEIGVLKGENVLLKMSTVHKAFYDASDETVKKAFAATPEGERDAYITKNPIKKAVQLSDDPIVKGIQTALEKSEAANVDMAKRIAAFEEDKAKDSFSKRAVDMGLLPADGEIMRKAYAGDATAQAALDKRIKEITKSAEEIAKTAGIFKEFGASGGAAGGVSAMDELNSLADTLRKTVDGAKLSTQQAFDRVYTNPANAEVVARYKAEDIAKRRAA